MNQLQNHTKFVADLHLEREAVMVFNIILQKEQDALVQGDFENLDFFVSDKTRTVEQLTSYGQQRKDYLVSQGFSPDSEGMDGLLAVEGMDTEAKTMWAELIQFAELAEQLNQINGTIITTRLQHSQRALSALQYAAGNVSMYASNGHIARQF
jgi:flagella synthesis protein FlgN